MIKLLKPTLVTMFILCMIVGYTYCQDRNETVKIRVDFAKEKGEMTPIWAWFGYDEPNYTYMKDGKKLLSEIAALSPVPVYVRAHCLLCTRA